jgi:hypothetical protein
MVWIKNRNLTPGYDNVIYDTVRGTGVSKALYTDTADAQNAYPDYQNLTSFNSNGFSVGTTVNAVNLLNTNSGTFASWTFREQPKFFDVVTYTGDGTSSQAISHNLGSTPGCIIIKPLQSASFNDWRVWHRSLTSQSYQLKLNTTEAEANVGNFIGQNSTTFTVGFTGANQSGIQYIAYLFAHNAGGFGLTGTDNVISCGSVLGGAEANLGFEPQWVLAKASGLASNWFILDTMRGFTADTVGSAQVLRPNESSAESTNNRGYLTSTGFVIKEVNGEPYIYIAIRRGPMKVPTDATKVFSPNYFSTGTSSPIVTNFPVDLQMYAYPPGEASINTVFVDRLRGVSTTTTTGGPRLITSGTAAESAAASSLGWSNTGFSRSPSFGPSDAQLYLNFRRAPSFFDEVCYTGTGVNRTVTHNLAAVPELMIVKGRSIAERWSVYSAPTTATAFLILDGTNAAITNNFFWNDTAPTSSVFTVGTQARVNNSGDTYVAYLFATCAGVSKVFSFTGNGTTQTINCGFAGGARFVLLKATSTTGGWYVYDTARGMTTLTDPYLFLNSTAAESATLGSVTTVTTGFAVNESVLAGVNTNGVSYIGLAIA